MKIFKMIRGFFLKRSTSYKIMQNVIFHVKLLSPTLNSKRLLEIYKRATHRAYGYLFCCFTQSCPDEIRYRTKVLQNEYPLLCFDFDFIQFFVSSMVPFKDPPGFARIR